MAEPVLLLIGLIAIKEISKKEFESQKKWFEAIHKHPKNAFVKYKKEIENLLRV